MCTTGNDVLHNHGIDGQNFASISKEVHSLVPNAFVFSHTLQGKSISFTLQEPNAWV